MRFLAEEQSIPFVAAPRNVLIVLGFMLLAMVCGTIIRTITLWGRTDEKARGLRLRLRSWWFVVLAIAAIMVLGRESIIVFFALISLLSLREFFRIVKDRRPPAQVLAWAYGGAVLLYVWMFVSIDPAWLVVGLVGLFLALCTHLIVLANPEGYTTRLGVTLWGFFACGPMMAHAAMLTNLPPEANPVGGNTGWLLFLILLTETNDIMQAIFGRRFGKRKIIPPISPGKSWEGLVGGIGTTVVLALLLAPVLTPLASDEVSVPYLWAAVGAVLIGVAGLLGDLNISGLKRDFGVKDSGNFLPGQGGLLDRVDSLIFSAPVFYYYLLVLEHFEAIP